MAAQETSEMVHIFTSGLLGLDQENNNDKCMSKVLKSVCKQGEDEWRQRVVLLRCLHEYGLEKEFARQELTTNRDYRYWDSDGWIGLVGVTDTDCDALAMLVESTATSISSPTHTLHIGWSSLTSSGLGNLLSSLIGPNCNISTLGLSNCQLDDECAKVFSQYLSVTKLTKLGLSGNRMTDAGVEYIRNYIPSTLDFLDLSGNLISNEYAEEFDAFCKENYPGLSYRNFSSKAPSRVPPEIIAHGRVAERTYQKALNSGRQVEIYRGCVKIIGQDRAGKTSLKRSLCGLSFNTEEESTVGVEVSLVTMNDVKSWSKVTDEGIIADVDVARTMARDIKMQVDLTGDTEGNDGRSNHVPLHVNPAIEASSEPLKQADEPAYLPQQVSSENIQVPKEVQQSPERNIEPENHEATTKKILEFSSKKSLKVPEGVKMSLIKYLQEKKIDETIKDKEDAISIWDFAGQHLYYASHPVFMSHRAIYILVYNLGKDLDDKAEPRARQGTREIVLDNASNETNLDNLLSWLVSVHCLCQPHTDSGVQTEDYICPPVIIVGTHADELPGSEDEKKRLIQTKQRKIESAIEKCEFQNHVLKPFFVVDNNKSADDDGIKSLHSKIKELLNMEPYFPEPVPIRWFHFEKALQSLVKEKKTSFLSVKELSEIAEQVCSIDQTEIVAMLNFYHRLGIIIKFGDTVVLDAKWLINLFKSLITIEPDEVKAKHRKFWKELAETGRLHTDLINHVFKEQLKYTPFEAKDDAKKDILDMMEYFGLISKIIPSDRKKEYCHLVPSHLTSSPEEELKKCHPSSGEPCPLYIRFKDGFIPHGLYFQLICRWCSIYGSQKRPNLFPIEPKLFRNAAKFVLDNNSKVIMTVVCCKSTIKICLHSNRENKTGVDFKAGEIRNLIQESLDSLTEKCPWYQSLQYDLCIRCPLCAVNATGIVEGHPFGDDNCLHPVTDNEEFRCEEKVDWPEVSGLHHWFSRTNSSASKPIHGVCQPEMLPTRITSTAGYLCLDENNKRWVVVGIAIMKVLLPVLRSFVLPKIAKHYDDLKANHNIHTQIYGAHLKVDGTYKLNYGSINSNQGKKPPLFDYKVKSEVDLSKLYLQPFMAKFNGIDETCDLSAVLGILSFARVFTAATQDAAKDVRQLVRNDWGHCNFTAWDEAKIADCFKFMNVLAKSLKLADDEEKKLLEQLKVWEEKGAALLLGNPADGGLLKLHEDVVLVLKEVQSLKESNPEEFQQINSSLQAFKEEVIKCLTKLEEGQKDLKEDVAAVASDMKAVKTLLEQSSIYHDSGKKERS